MFIPTNTFTSSTNVLDQDAFEEAEVGVFHQISKNVGYLYGLVVLIFKY